MGVGITTLCVGKGNVIASAGSKVENWYVVVSGEVLQYSGFARVRLEKDSVIGIGEEEKYICDYAAYTDVTLLSFAHGDGEEFADVFNEEPRLRRTILRAALLQRQMLIKSHAGFKNLAERFHELIEAQYREYGVFCEKYREEPIYFPRMEHYYPLELIHKTPKWMIEASDKLSRDGLEPYIALIQKEDAVCIGVIMEMNGQSRRILLGIVEMVEYLKENRGILLSESENDIFNLYFKLLLTSAQKQHVTKPLTEHMDQMADIIKKLGIYDPKLVETRLHAYNNYETLIGKNVSSPESKTVSYDDVEPEGELNEDCLRHILSYAGMEDNAINEIRNTLRSYQSLPDTQESDNEARLLRRTLSQMFYDAYYRVFMHAVRYPGTVTPIVEMFLNFGFMDVHMAGEENANILYDLTGIINVCSSVHVYTIFTWLKSIYEGKNEPSRNEFDLDYPGYLVDMRRNGNITEEQQRAYLNNNEMKLKFEIQNMFMSGSRATYGKASSFCPILSEEDLFNSAEKMLVTAEKIEGALNELKKIDFSVFYREVQFSDPDRGINREMIMKEVLPDIILMPNAGSRAMMWQETAGIRKDTPARFLFPIFTAVDLYDMMIETVARYRWEICRKIQGVHWNDIREKSLTAEYCDYVQFYKKNHELSAEAKEKIQIALKRGRNNYREVFVKDYQNWIKFESQGSFRLNRVAREILLTYCPFAKDIRDMQKSNPTYQSAWSRYDVHRERAMSRLRGLYDKYEKAGGEITEELKNNLEYYDM